VSASPTPAIEIDGLSPIADLLSRPIDLSRDTLLRSESGFMLAWEKDGLAILSFKTLFT
jgi:hypothetical protein